MNGTSWGQDGTELLITRRLCLAEHRYIREPYCARASENGVIVSGYNNNVFGFVFVLRGAVTDSKNVRYEDYRRHNSGPAGVV